jgi:hypothetical protein
MYNILGMFALKYTSMHVIVPYAHAFEKSIVNTVVQDDINPIRSVQRSLLSMMSVIHQEQNTSFFLK